LEGAAKYGRGVGDTIGYGVIGSGMMGGEHILDLNHVEGASVVALADPVESSLEWGLGCVAAGPDGDAARQRTAVYSDHRDLLAAPNVDVVIITTPNHTHAAVLADALGTDKHVLIEKPLCTTVDDCKRVVDAAADRDAITWMGLQYRFMPTPAAMLEQLATGVCGTTRMVSIREHRFPFLKKVGDWNRFSANTGGTLVEKCCHFFDLMHLVAGAHPVRVMASGGQDVNHLDEEYEVDGRIQRPDILDNAFVIVEFANGVRGALDLCMFAEGGRFEQELTITGDLAKMEATVPGDVIWLGDRATAGAPGSRPGSGVREIGAPMDPRVPYPDFHQGASFMEHLALADAIRAGRPAAVTVTEGMWAVATGAAAHRSITERRPVDLSEFGLG
jgi:myo-inositol 2-dehydrogenase / D-chiro-inositol 1-dehydrogenase